MHVPVCSVQFCNSVNVTLVTSPSLPPSLQALTEYKRELRDDPIISTHLDTLYDNLLEQNLIRVIEPFSRVQVGPPPHHHTSPPKTTTP